MNGPLQSLWHRCAVILAAWMLVGCAPLISPYSAEAYKSATTLKAETAALVDKSNENYSKHATEVTALSTRIDAAYEFAAGLPKNEISAQQWSILRDPNGDLYGAFVRLWKKAGSVSPAYKDEKKDQISRAYDAIICLEANKLETKPCTAVTARGL